MKINHLIAALGVAVCLEAQPAMADPYDDGLKFYSEENYTAAIQVWRPLAEQGDVDAQYFLGVLYENGKGVPQDYPEAVKWYRIAAEKGSANAQSNLG